MITCSGFISMCMSTHRVHCYEMKCELLWSTVMQIISLFELLLFSSFYEHNLIHFNHTILPDGKVKKSFKTITCLSKERIVILGSAYDDDAAITDHMKLSSLIVITHPIKRASFASSKVEGQTTIIFLNSRAWFIKHMKWNLLYPPPLLSFLFSFISEEHNQSNHIKDRQLIKYWLHYVIFLLKPQKGR